MSNREKSSRSKVKDYLAYLMARFFICILQILSYRAAIRFAKRLGQLVYHLDRRHRKVALDNLRHAYSELSEEEREEMVRAMYVHLCTMFVEILHLPRRLTVRHRKNYLDMHDGDKVMKAICSNRPVLLVTGHFGNWEISSWTLGLTFPTYAIAREIDNPYIDNFIRQFRERTRQRILAKRGEFDRIEAVLAQGGVLGTLADQDAGSRGQFVEFFGRPASTHKAVALLAIEHNVVMVVVGTPFLENREVRGQWFGSPGRYEVLVEDVIDPEDYQDRPDAIAAITERFTQAWERMVRHAPEQYFWVHRRWKSEPRKRKPRKKKEAA